jgi:predicted  nucleic acid-binding Zn-ribbon protein
VYPNTNGNPTSQVIELSRKNRALNLMLEKERARVAQLQQALSEASAAREGGGAAHRIQQVARSVVQAAEAADSAAKEAAAWRERTQQQTNKLSQLEQKVCACAACIAGAGHCAG